MPEVVLLAGAHGAVGQKDERPASNQPAHRVVRVNPRIPAGGFVVGHLDGQAGFFSNANGFAHRIEKTFGFVSHVRDIHAVIFRRDLGQFDHLFGFRESARHIEQSGRKAERAFFHGLRDQLLHLLDLGRRGVAIHAAHDFFTNRALAGV